MTEPTINDHDPDLKTGPCKMTFIGFPYRNEDGSSGSLTYSVIVADGRFKEVIDGVKEIGGIWMPTPEGNSIMANQDAIVGFFMPWPCAAVRLERA